VAPLGTALTEAQLERLMWRMSDAPLLCFDGDGAGQKAAMRAAMRACPMLEPGFHARGS
jgi:DNA primase